MRRKYRIALLAGLVAIAPVIAGCSDFDLDSLDVFHLNEKKKLPGERKELFPGGVPGVTQGIPPEYMKGNQQQQTEAAIPDTPGAPAPGAAGPPPAAQPAPAAKTAAVEPAAEPKPKAKPKRKPKPVAKKNVTVQPVAQQQQRQQQQQQQQLEPWPGAPAQQQPAQASDPWLNAPPPPTTLSR